MRPKRLFGFDGTAGKDPSSSTGLMSLGAFGLSPATAPGTLTRAAIRKLQADLSAGLNLAAKICSDVAQTAPLRIAERLPHPRSLRDLDLSPRSGER